jgi:hypothetical protein
VRKLWAETHGISLQNFETFKFIAIVPNIYIIDSFWHSPHCNQCWLSDFITTFSSLENEMTMKLNQSDVWRRASSDMDFYQFNPIEVYWKFRIWIYPKSANDKTNTFIYSSCLTRSDSYDRENKLLVTGVYVTQIPTSVEFLVKECFWKCKSLSEITFARGSSLKELFWRQIWRELKFEWNVKSWVDFRWLEWKKFEFAEKINCVRWIIDGKFWTWNDMYYYWSWV